MISSRKIDLIFIIIFFVFLYIPMIKISNAEISIAENRTFSKYPSLFINGYFNEKFASEFDNWFNDRFNGRETLIQLYSDIHYFNDIISNQKAIYFKENGWMFNRYPKFKKYSQQKISDALNQVKNFINFCNEHNIKIYILIVPNKEWIYYSKFKNLYPDFEKRESFITSIEELSTELGHRFVFPYRKLSEASKDNFVFFKASHHWTELGSYLGYLELIASVKQDFKDVVSVELNEYTKFQNKMIRDDWNRNFNSGHTTNLLNIPSWYTKEKILIEDYDYYDHKRELKPAITDISGYKIKHFLNTNSDKKYKVFVSGFSQNENLLNFLPYSFKEVKYYRLNNVIGIKEEEEKRFLKRYKQDLLTYKPDILILTISIEQFFSKELWSLD